MYYTWVKGSSQEMAVVLDNCVTSLNCHHSYLLDLGILSAAERRKCMSLL